jgi:hypothetical protein
MLNAATVYSELKRLAIQARTAVDRLSFETHDPVEAEHQAAMAVNKLTRELATLYQLINLEPSEKKEGWKQ